MEMERSTTDVENEEAGEEREGVEGEESENLSRVKTFEDLLELAGSRGPWNILLFILCSYMSFLTSLHVMSYQFLGATPDHWCRVEPLEEANWTREQVLSFAIPIGNVTEERDSCHTYNYNYTAAAEMGYDAAVRNLPSSTNLTLPCHTRHFNSSQYQSTVVTQWDLVCSRRPLYSTTMAAMRLGDMMATPLMGFFLDRYGRRRVILVLLPMYILAGFLIVLSPSVEVYIAVRTLIAALITGVNSGGFVLLMETCATRDRSSVGPLFAVPWAFGVMLTPSIGYLVRTWQWLSVCLSLPHLLSLSFYWLLPESPRWLMQAGRCSEALTVLKKAARMNDKTLPPDHQMLLAMDQITRQETNERLADERDVMGWQTSGVRTVFQRVMAPLIRPELRFRSLVYFMWFTAGLVYYGVSLNAINIGVDPYLYLFLGGVMEAVAYILLWPVTLHLGRRKALVALYLLCGICILLVMIILLVWPEGSYSLVMVLSLSGKMASSAMYQLIWTYTTELFPTECRSVAFNQADFMASAGSIMSPYINDILGDVMVWAPSAVFGCTSLATAVLAMVLPETRDATMAEFKSLTKEVNSPPLKSSTEEESNCQ